jgi:RNA polymerase sigma-70 factor (ECF subfamily)
MESGTRSYQRYRAGDEQALAEIVELYNQSLILFINRYVHNLSDAEDLAAETFLHLILKKPRFKQESSFKTYLFAIGRNKAVDWIRKQARHPQIPLDDQQLSEHDLLLETLIRQEKRVEMLRAITTLPPDYRDVLHLLYWEDMSYSDAAKVLNKRVKQINNLAYRARNALKSVLEQKVT